MSKSMNVYRKRGTGTIRKGYLMFGRYGAQEYEHKLIAEKALGKKLPAGAVIHHVNGNPLDNRNENLVICQDQAYHLLIHARQRALEACGDANARPCVFCKRYDSVQAMSRHGRSYRHKQCVNVYNRALKQRRASSTEASH